MKIQTIEKVTMHCLHRNGTIKMLVKIASHSQNEMGVQTEISTPAATKKGSSVLRVLGQAWRLPCDLVEQGGVDVHNISPIPKISPSLVKPCPPPLCSNQKKMKDATERL